jgi:hypothetical protein
MQQMDQELLQPPNVRGWVGGDNWITAATLFTRYNTATFMVTGQAQGFGGRRGPGGAGQQFTPEQMQAFMQQRAARAANAPGAGPATQPSVEQIRARLMQRRAAEDAVTSTPPPQPSDRPVAPSADRQRLMQQDPQARQQMQMMQQFGRGFTQPPPPVNVAKLLPDLGATPTATQVVDAAIAHFLQRPLHPEKRAALVEALGDGPINIGTPESDSRIRQVLSLVMSTPEYQVD